MTVRAVLNRLHLSALSLLTVAAVMTSAGWCVREVHDRWVAQVDFACLPAEAEAATLDAFVESIEDPPSAPSKPLGFFERIEARNQELHLELKAYLRANPRKTVKDFIRLHRLDEELSNTDIQLLEMSAPTASRRAKRGSSRVAAILDEFDDLEDVADENDRTRTTRPAHPDPAVQAAIDDWAAEQRRKRDGVLDAARACSIMWDKFIDESAYSSRAWGGRSTGTRRRFYGDEDFLLLLGGPVLLLMYWGTSRWVRWLFSTPPAE